MNNEDNCYSVYVHTNKKNGKKYVGCTSQIPPSSRWGKNGYGYHNGQEKFYNAIQEYGWENFEHIIIKSHLTREDAWKLEEEKILEYDSVINGYNSAYGGEHNKLSENSKKKLRNQRYGKNNPNYNPNKTLYVIKTTEGKNIYRKNKNYTFSSEEESHDRRKSIEFRNRQRELKLGKNNPNYGKHAWSYGLKMTENQKQKMIDSYTAERREKNKRKSFRQ